MVKLWVKNIILAGIILFGTGVSCVVAQDLRTIFIDNSGMQIGAFRGQTELQDRGFSHSFRFYNRHNYSPTSFGELSVSIGTISGLGYRSRLLPFEYRYAMLLDQYGAPGLSVFGRRGELYGYAGFGLLYHRPLEVSAPDDPLTAEQGDRLSASALWDFNTGFAPFIPLGIGLNLPVDQQAAINISIGYNQSLNALKLSEHYLPSGYWAVSIGMNFKRERKAPPRFTIPSPVQVYESLPPPPSPSLAPALPIASAPVEKKELYAPVLHELNRTPINFEILSSEIDDEGKEWIDRMSNLLELNREMIVQVFGHADSIGTDQINEFISESRARATWLAFTDAGVSPNRLSYNWYADRRPVSTNQTRDGRFQNRRVEFILDDTKVITERKKAVEVELEYTLGEPLYFPFQISFELLNYANDEMLINMAEVAGWMANNREISLFVASVSNLDYTEEMFFELDKARSEKLKADLIKMGVEPYRIQAYNPYKDELPEEFRSLMMPALPQQTLIIPVINK